MPIVRVIKRSHPFVQIDKRPLEDDRLSFKAKGLLAYLLSRPSNWQVRMEQLAGAAADGRTALASALQELKRLGYARLEQLRSDDGTKSLGKTWVVFELPPTEGGELGMAESLKQWSELRGFVYIVKTCGLYKVGWTTDFPRRFSQIKRTASDAVKVLVEPGSLAHEQLLHRMLWKFSAENERYRLTSDQVTIIGKALKSDERFGLAGFASYLHAELNGVSYTQETAVKDNPCEGKSAPNKKGSEKKNGKNKGILPELPLLLRRLDPEWQRWLKYRREVKRKPVTPHGATMQIDQMLEWGLERARAALLFSMRQEYTGLFEPNNATKKTTTKKALSNEDYHSDRR